LPAALFFRFQSTDWTARSAGCSIRLAQVGSAYSITSPAIASSVGGTVSPGALAVPALTIGSAVVGCV